MQKPLYLTDFYSRFRACSSFYARFHLLFASLLVSLAFSCLLLFSRQAKSGWSALILALFVLTLFAYLVLSFFFQAKRHDQMLTLKDRLAKQLAHLSPFALAEGAKQVENFLGEQEEDFLEAKTPFLALNPLLTKLQIRLHLKNFQAMKEQLLFLSIESLLEAIRRNPTDSKAHASLANSYLALSQLYQPFDQERFALCTQRALEELFIVKEWEKDNPQVYEQLAKVYHLQGDRKQEIAQYETLTALLPNTPSLLLALGLLYCQEGRQSQALTLYAQLQKEHPKEALTLLKNYDPFSLQGAPFFFTP